MQVNVSNQQKDLTFLQLGRSVKEIVSSVLTLENEACDEVSIYFVTNRKMMHLHELFFNDPSPTDCISLPMDEENDNHYRVLGEIFVCPKTACHYALTHQSDPYYETTLYLVHGMLHLIGYDDIDPQDRKLMKQAEKRHMQYLQKKRLMLSSRSLSNQTLPGLKR